MIIICSVNCIAAEQDKYADIIDKEISNTQNMMDSLDNEIKLYSKDTVENEYSISECRHVDTLLDIKMEDLLSKKRKLILTHFTEKTIPVYAFRDSILDSIYDKGYYDTSSPSSDTSIWLMPSEGIACNSDMRKKITYGFANLHNRNKKLRIDFEKFSRIGIYSMFPETFGCIEMIFAENREIEKKNIIKRLISQAHKYNTKVDLVLSYYKWEKTNYMRPRMDLGAVLLNMADSVSEIIKKYDFDGITIDFDINRMDIPTIMCYKEFIFRVNREFKSYKKKLSLNIVISAAEILDTTRYRISDLDDSTNKRFDNINKRIDSLVNIVKRQEYKALRSGMNNGKNNMTKLHEDSALTKIDYLLRPDQKDYIDLILVNLDFTYVAGATKYKAICPVDGIHDDKKTVIGIKKIINDIDTTYDNMVVPVLPLYGNIWKNDKKQGKYFRSKMIQKNYPEMEDLQHYNNDFRVLMDTNLFCDDLSLAAFEEKVRLIMRSNFKGVGVWNIEYGNEEFYKMVENVRTEDIKSKDIPRLLILKHFYWLRVFIGPNRIGIGIILAFFIILYISLILYAYIAGKEKIVDRNIRPFLITGTSLFLLSCIYIETIPINIYPTLRIVLIVSMIVLISGCLGLYFYKVQKSKDLP